MVQLVGKIVPGVISAITGLYVIAIFGKEIDTSALLVAGLMFYWGISTAYYPFLDGIEELRDYLHKLSERKLNEMGVRP